MTKIISDGIERKCWHCFESMEPTEEMYYSHCRMYKCPRCGAKFLWHEDPAMDGSYAQKHKYKGEHCFDSISMESDPECGVYGPKKYPDPPGPEGPFRKRIDGKSFRWHKGRGRWVLWET